MGYLKGSPDEAPVKLVGIAVVSFGYISGVNERNYDIRIMLCFLACLTTVLPVRPSSATLNGRQVISQGPVCSGSQSWAFIRLFKRDV